MRLYDTLRRRKEPFAAERGVKLYVCGVTPYDTTHVGHARTYVVFDVLVRHLRQRGHSVRYVQNITDVDDSILARAAELDVSFEDLGRHYTDVYMQDMRDLNMLPADVYPAATETIPDMRDMIGRLIERGHAYRLDNGDVYFRIASSDGYGELSRLSRSEMCALEREQDGSTIDDARKEDPLDFPLWRAARPGEPRWPSPWGEGRPGWHIECSAMALKHLGTHIDIHGGGSDLVYPHHECERAQSEASTGVRPFASFWVHVEMVRLHGEKISKSLGNLVFVRDLLERFSSDGLRLYVLGRHYRTPLDFDEAELSRAEARAERLRTASETTPGEEGESDAGANARRRFLDALEDDLDTPAAVEALTRLGEEILSRPCAGDRRALVELGHCLGLRWSD